MMEFKSNNHKKIYNIIRKYGQINSVDMQDKVDVTLPTMLKVAKELEKSGYVHIYEGASTGGRKPMVYEANFDAAYAFGFVIQPDTDIDLLFINLKGDVLHRERIPWREELTADETIDALSTAVENVIKAMLDFVPREKISGVGIGSVGAIDDKKGMFLSDGRKTIKSLSNVKICKLLAEKTGMPVYLNNLARVGLLAHQWSGWVKNVGNGVYIYNHNGIGSALLMGGKIPSTSRDMTGAFGHMMINVNSTKPPCKRCGKVGCLESYVSETIMIEQMKEALRQGQPEVISENRKYKWDDIHIEEIYEAADIGDALATEIVDEASRILGAALSNYLNLSQSEIIILGGEAFELCNRYFDQTREFAMSGIFSHNKSNIRIVKDDLLPSGYALGSAIQVFDKMCQ